MIAMSEKRLFRQAALDRLASPDQLDRLLTVADRRGWLVLVLLAVLGAGLLGWSITGAIPVTQRAAGILTAPGAHFLTIAASDGGTLATLDAAPGVAVRAGQTVATVVTAGGATLVQPAPASGHILEWKQAPGARVPRGAPLLTLEAGTGAGSEALVFVPASAGKTVTPGMPALLTAAGATGKRDGVLRGTVSSVSPYPLSTEAIGALLANPALAAAVAGGAPAYAVRVALVAPAPTGVLVRADITLRTRRPIALLLSSE